MVDINSLLAKSKQQKKNPAKITTDQVTGITQKPNPFAALSKKVSETKNATDVKPPAKVAEKQADATMEVNPADIEATSAKEFQSEDQPDGYEASAVEELKQSISILQDGFENKELISEALKNIMLLLRRHEFLKDMLLPEDCGAMVRALRESYGRVITVKNTRSNKKIAVQKDVTDVMSELDGLDITI